MLFFLLLLFSIVFSAPFKNTQNCNKDNCKLPECYCPSTNIPGNLALADTPQFVLFTMDDSMYESDYNRMNNYSWIFNNDKIKDSLGCTVKLSWYSLEIWSDYNFINYISKVGDVNLHTYDHATSATSTESVWTTQLKTLLDHYPQLAQIPDCTLLGSRAPYLQPNDGYFATLAKLGIKYDSSMTYCDKVSHKSYWPFTLDYGVPDERMCNYFGDSCPTKAFPGLWEFPMTEFDYEEKGNLMDPEFHDYKTYLQKMKDNFLDTYNTNKVPRGFYWHWRYFSTDSNFGLINQKNPINETKVQLFTDFYSWLSEFPDVIFATERQVLEWMKNPVNYEKTKNLNMFKACPNKKLNPGNTCKNGITFCDDYGDMEGFSVCGTQCPQQFPSLGNTLTFLNNYKNYVGSCETFDGMAIGTGSYEDQDDTSNNTDDTSNENNGSAGNSSNDGHENDPNSDSTPTDFGICDSNNCKLPNCFCPSVKIPGDLDVISTPQFVIVSFEGSMSLSDFKRMKNYEWIFSSKNIKDSLGCTVKPSWYISELGSDYSFINYLSQVGDINVMPSKTYNLGMDWQKDISSSISNYVQLSETPRCIIQGSRAPNFSANTEYFTALKSLGFLFDSSMTCSNSVQNAAYWPYTLDYGVPDKNMCNYWGECPKKAFAGLWEFPVVEFDQLIKENVIDPFFDNYQDFLMKMKEDFTRNYNRNKVPRNYVFSWRYFSSDKNNGILQYNTPINTAYKQFFVDFFEWMVKSFPDIIFATERQVIKWIQEPMSKEDVGKTKLFSTCSNSKLNYKKSCKSGPITCYYPTLIKVSVCGTKCPSAYPSSGKSWTFPNKYVPFCRECITFEGEKVGAAPIVVNDPTDEINNNTNADTNTNNSNANTTSSFCDSSKLNCWEGTVTKKWFAGSGNSADPGEDGWFCMEFYLNNTSSSQTAKGFVINFNSCKETTFLTEVWGYLIEYKNSTNSFIMKGSEVSIKPKANIYVGGFCMAANYDISSTKKFSFERDLTMKGYLYDATPDYTLPNDLSLL